MRFTPSTFSGSSFVTLAFGVACGGVLSSVACSANDDSAATTLPVSQSSTGTPEPSMSMSVAAPAASVPDVPAAPPEPASPSDLIVDDPDDPTNGGEDLSGLDECASADAPAKLSRVVLAFVFDVSASMGSEQRPYDSRTLKWDPVVAATKDFFADPNSRGISATLTFFPNEYAILTGENAPAPAPTPMAPPNGMAPVPGMGMAPVPGMAPPTAPQMFGVNTPAEVCDSLEYSTPDVGLTELPSSAFATAIDTVTPPDNDTWRLSTPTLAALQGTFQAIDAMRAQDPDSKYSIVLVTDGMPALCEAFDDSVADVADAVASVADSVPTYVIGVENPTVDGVVPPDSLGGLNQVAVAGGTENAFLIDTNDPVQTSTDLKAIIDSIREDTFSCSLQIPEPPNGLLFDKEQVNVQFTNANGDIPFSYDPECAGTSGWRFDDAENPSTIQLCDSACESLLSASGAAEGQLDVQFGCARRDDSAR